MNRQQRRAAESRQRRGVSPGRDGGDMSDPAQPDSGASDPPRPGLMLRLTSKILLSGWVLRRVRHPQVLAMLREVARQSGRADIVDSLTQRLARR